MNDKKTKKTVKQKKYVFQVHTMQGDNKLKTTSSVDASTVSLKSKNKLSNIKQKQNLSNQFKQSKEQVSNPFLADDTSETEQNLKKGLFAPSKQKETIEKINQRPADIVSQKKKIGKHSSTDQKKIVHVIMLIFIVVFLIGIVIFGVYMLKFNTHRTVEDVNISNDKIENEIQLDDNVDANTSQISDDVSLNDENINEQMYSTSLPNYLSIDIESATVKEDISAELDTIIKNMQQQDIKGPISFIITDKNSNPISFNVFAISADMNIPEAIGSSLEEGFEMYAYNDELKGIRFGFVVDIKDIQIFQTAVSTNETKLPKLFDIILNNLGTSAVDIIFKDSYYKTHPIRYYNLNSTETYSVDYTINNKQWIIGTTKDTLRAIIDFVNSAKDSSGDVL